MKIIITILALVLAGTFSQASEGFGLPGETSLIPAIHSIPLDSDTQVVEVNVLSRHAVSCPGTLELKSHLNFNGQGSILTANKKADVIRDLIKRVSSSCSAEILESTLPPTVHCLSFGHEGGRVYLDARRISKDVKALEIALPAYLEIESTVQLKL